MNEQNQQTNYFIVCIEGDPKRYVLALGDHPFHYGEKVVFKNEYGAFIGTISSFKFPIPPKKSNMGIFKRYATEADLKKFKCRQILAIDFRNEIREQADKLRLDMNITHVLYPLQSEALIIYYTADDRVDFREFLIWLRENFKKQITMRQITPRQRAEAITHFSSIGELARRRNFVSEV